MPRFHFICFLLFTPQRCFPAKTHHLFILMNSCVFIQISHQWTSPSTCYFMLLKFKQKKGVRINYSLWLGGIATDVELLLLLLLLYCILGMTQGMCGDWWDLWGEKGMFKSWENLNSPLNGNQWLCLENEELEWQLWKIRVESQELGLDHPCGSFPYSVIDSMILWCFDSMIPWSYDSIISWFHSKPSLSLCANDIF